MKRSELCNYGKEYINLTKNIQEYKDEYHPKLIMYKDKYKKLSTEEELIALNVASVLDVTNAGDKLTKLSEDTSRLLTKVKVINGTIEKGSFKDKMYQVTERWSNEIQSVYWGILTILLLAIAPIMLNIAISINSNTTVDPFTKVLKSLRSGLGIEVGWFNYASIGLLLIHVTIYIVLRKKYMLNDYEGSDENDQNIGDITQVNTYKMEKDLIKLSKDIEDSITMYNNVKKDYKMVQEYVGYKN